MQMVPRSSTPDCERDSKLATVVKSIWPASGLKATLFPNKFQLLPGVQVPQEVALQLRRSGKRRTK